MGCGTSTGAGCRLNKELYLPSTELRFNAGQIQRLNVNFLSGYENLDDLPTCGNSREIKTTIDQIIQRLLCGIGILDKRFASKFLVNSEPISSNVQLSKSYTYYVRLDSLSEPNLYEDDYEYSVRCVTEEDNAPQGFVKIRIVSNQPEQWNDLTDDYGYLRRDKVKMRFIELLAISASKIDILDSPENVDESYLCGCPGKIIDAGVLHEIINIPPEEHIYFGLGFSGQSRFPDIKDLCINVVEDAQCVKLRVSGPKLPTEVAIVLLPFIQFESFPKYTDLLSRVPITHPDILLHQRACSMGYFVVPITPHQSVRCFDRQSTWQIRFPGAECLYQTHYSERSVISNINHFLQTKIPKLRNGDSGVCVVSGYILKSLLWFRLEECGSIEQWDHGCVAGHILIILDTLVAALRAQHHRSYFFPYVNIILNSPKAGRTIVPEDDYQNDVEIIEAYMYGLFEKSLGSDSIVTGQAFENPDQSYWMNLESVMLHKWHRVLDTISPKQRKREYSKKQLEYISEVFKGMLATRNFGKDTTSWCFLNEEKLPHCIGGGRSGRKEVSLDTAYLVSVVIEQALAAIGTRRDIKSVSERNLGVPCFKIFRNKRSDRQRRIRCPISRRISDDKNEAARQLLSSVYTDAVTTHFKDDFDLVKFVLDHLHTAAQSDRRLTPSLQPFLQQLYDVSRKTCWHLDEWQRRWDKEELHSLGTFARLLCRNAIQPTEALHDAIQKGWSWADNLLQVLMEFQDGVEIICIPESNNVQRFSISLPKIEKENFASRSLGRMTDKNYFTRADTVSSKFKTVRGWSFLDVDSILSSQKKNTSKDITTIYNCLHCQSPMTKAVTSSRQRSNHRVLGNIVNALITLQKYTEMCAVLPEDKQGPVLDDIRKISKERQRKRRDLSLSQDVQTTGIYRSMSELSLSPNLQNVLDSHDTSSITLPDLKNVISENSLLSTLRIARHKQSNNATTVYNPAFYDAPVAFTHNDTSAIGRVQNPLCQPYLRMTQNNEFSLSTDPMPFNDATKL
ncbi:uncharacterized protein LOC126903728 isoform X2 [Daktulosphaira vitifoliae]|uniref:uncharacterized protein LOC126903728 isoform X2 n=1 Tax=Daktulosphaira vitifoliae TaxID=58002 RepID=UPI0021AABB23|nr:uncharacterized protein LOC126903728 isoform X2 [Daktulosphaira vitifoliae]